MSVGCHGGIVISHLAVVVGYVGESKVCAGLKSVDNQQRPGLGGAAIGKHKSVAVGQVSGNGNGFGVGQIESLFLAIDNCAVYPLVEITVEIGLRNAHDFSKLKVAGIVIKDIKALVLAGRFDHEGIPATTKRSGILPLYHVFDLDVPTLILPIASVDIAMGSCPLLPLTAPLKVFLCQCRMFR